jgi:superfamily II DNA or RNA helicase
MPKAAVKASGTAAPKKTRPVGMQKSLHDKLVLVRWALNELGIEKMENLVAPMKSESLEGVAADGETRFLKEIVNRHGSKDSFIDPERLSRYDRNIVSHTNKLNGARSRAALLPVTWKYFQYLSLLFVEMYLDGYFSDPSALRNSMNIAVEQINSGLPTTEKISKLDMADDPRNQLNKLALWNATGSGKTLLMHVNLAQYQQYIRLAAGVAEPNKILLLTPNDGLSIQHLSEFQTSGISSELFDKNRASLFSDQVEILDIHKLTKGEPGPETVSVESLEGNNLVLVDEGHRGASGGDDGLWFSMRTDLCRGGFSFEYSATFGQAVAGDTSLTDQYSKSVIFDYSYKYFYGDGFGKDYAILNLDGTFDETLRNRYLIGGLLVFFEQLKLHHEKGSQYVPFQIDKPLWVLVGSSVNSVRKEGGAEVSDVIDVLLFLRDFCANKKDSVSSLKSILKDGLKASDGQDIFEGKFQYLRSTGITAEQVFGEILEHVFNASSGGVLSVERIKGFTGEIALRVGADSQPFGVINVGDTPKLAKLCESNGLKVTELEFADSFFQSINQKNSTITVLIGSKKFTEGWNSWRVSTLALMNVGKSEGSQIIQLFGRGVRLKGYGFSLKRSSRAELPGTLKAPDHIKILETLNVFGVRANYMAQFRQHLESEGANADELVPVSIPVINNLGRLQPTKRKLKKLRIKSHVDGLSTADGEAFRVLGHVSKLRPPTATSDDKLLRKNRVQVNLYPKIRIELSDSTDTSDVVVKHEKRLLTSLHIALVDIDQVVRDVARYRRNNMRNNVVLDRAAVVALLADQTWYDLYIPDEDFDLSHGLNPRRWQNIVTTLLCKYVDSFQAHQRSVWEQPHLEYADVEADDPNFPTGGAYEIWIDKSKTKLIADLTVIAKSIGNGDLTSWSIEVDAVEARPLEKVVFDRHLYEPLFSMESGVPVVSPVPLNDGERKFLNDLKEYWKLNASKHGGVDLYVLRNLTRGRGVGFFEAGNFYPDFIVWLVQDGRQDIIFLDPKGLFHVGADDPKIQFHATIKELESRIAPPVGELIGLHSYILSRTKSKTVTEMWGLSKEEIEARNVLFLEDSNYVERIVQAVLPTMPARGDV